MTDLLVIVFSTLFVLISIPVFVFVIQVGLAFIPIKKKLVEHFNIESLAILIPAHNESIGISQTLSSVKKLLGKYEKIADVTRVVVVADNCSDDTASIARQYGAEVIERFSSGERGKGYALDYGLKHIRNNPPAHVLILDADCLLSNDSIPILLYESITYQRPIQGLYLMYANANAPIKQKIAQFAWLVKNLVRPLGFHHVGLPCQLMGSGMMFPWAAIKQADLATGHIVEDMKLGIDLAKLNLAPRFCPEALILSYFPISEEGLKTQRTRWEHGHIAMIVKECPALIFEGLRLRSLSILALALDIAVPPLALLILLLVILNLVGVSGFYLTRELFPWGLISLDLILIGISVCLAWVKFGRSVIPFSSLLMVPIYILIKIPIYVKFIVRRQAEWIRSKRD